MSRMISVNEGDPAEVNAMQAFQNLIQGLVRDASVLQAIQSGEIDAIINPANGKPIILSDTLDGLRKNEARLRSLLMLNSDVEWEQDERYCFTSYTHVVNETPPIFTSDNVVGKMLWELPFNNMSEHAWQVHQDQLEARKTFQDLKLRCVDRSGNEHEISVSGEPVFDAQGRGFTGYRGVIKDITARERAQLSPGRGDVILNTLLAALPGDDYQRLLAKSESVTLTYGETLYESGQRIEYVYFPEDSIVSLLTQVENHRRLETGLVGYEGMVGIPVVLGAEVSNSHALVQGTGTAVRIEAAHFRNEFLQSVPMQKILDRFVHVLMAQIEQTVACNHFHTVEARLARWLLMTRDRTQSNDLYLTHEFLSGMLGVRRAGVTLAANALRKRRLISYRRGNIKIINRRSLESAACTCYRIIKKIALKSQ